MKLAVCQQARRSRPYHSSTVRHPAVQPGRAADRD